LTERRERLEKRDKHGAKSKKSEAVFAGFEAGAYTRSLLSST